MREVHVCDKSGEGCQTSESNGAKPLRPCGCAMTGCEWLYCDLPHGTLSTQEIPVYNVHNNICM